MMQNQQLHVDGRPAGPEVEMTFALDIGSTIHSVTDGIAEAELSYDAVHLVDAGTLDPAQVNMFESTMEGLVGLTFFATLDDLGNTLAVDIPRFPAMGSAADQLLDEFELPSLPLPVEAVGVGARWTVESEQAPYADARMPMVTEYELVELHDDRFVVRQRSTATVEPSVVEVGGAITEFHEGEIITAGTMTWSFDSFQPFGEHTSSGSIHFSESYGSQSVDGELFQRARISIRPLD
jgi:hypothetical protein